MTTNLVEGTQAPSFSLESIDGKTYTLSDFTDKPLVLFFFGHNCTLCISSSPKVNELESKYRGAVNFVGIDVYDGSESAVRSFESITEVTFTLLLNGASVGSTYSVTKDRLVVINTDQELIHQGATAAQNDINNVSRILDDLLP